jgi:hypothetical protein
MHSLASSQASVTSDFDSEEFLSFLEPAESSHCPFEKITKEQIDSQITEVLCEISKVIEHSIDDVALLLPLFK